jgi:hypothetical protein
MLSLMSIPQIRPSGPTSPAISAASNPGPTPTSSTRSPRRSASAARTARRCSITSGVVYTASICRDSSTSNRRPSASTSPPMPNIMVLDPAAGEGR